MTVKYYGKASHAAAYPWEVVNALDTSVLAYNNLSVLRQQMKPTWRVHGEFFIKSNVQQVRVQAVEILTYKIPQFKVLHYCTQLV